MYLFFRIVDFILQHANLYHLSFIASDTEQQRDISEATVHRI